ncbi:aminotransferase class V-fold PLP-dependent enzyme [Kocuria sp.]|uniref:aminotransferase class V-fold PLP-dependent enzyme n=1 Tax=Kocuria sp. TaxID=1871328 RepID=UPI0026DB4A0F|nr:aminotransferase class V-fold PLP-dependent enzyme [Kocuria sp.]MDO4920178.1 aminotransferase class V-fold PLP-dependent enzyme [Kocuria sp.]
MSTAPTPSPLGTPIVQPIHHSAAYAFETLGQAQDVFAQRAGGFTYARTGNPNVAALEAEIARREHGVGAVAASSGQAAVALALLTLTGPARDAHAVVSSRIYGGTVDLLTDTLADTGLEVTFADPREPQQWEDAVRDGTRVFFLESIANPLTELPELEAIARIAHRHGAVVLVDNTVATPYLCTPGEHGADFVVHSATKYLAGHGGPLGGLLVATGAFDPMDDAARWPWLTRAHPRWGGRSPVELFGAQKAVLGVARCKYLNDLGPCLGATAAHEILQGMATLDVRVERQSATASALAAALSGHPAVERAHHPSLAEGRQRELYAAGGYRGGGGLFSVDVRGTPAQVAAVVNGLETIRLAANIGDVRTLVAHPAGMTHCRLTPEQFRASGITERTLRFSVGLEDEAELLADLLRALDPLAARSEREGAREQPASPHAQNAVA